MANVIGDRKVPLSGALAVAASLEAQAKTEHINLHKFMEDPNSFRSSPSFSQFEIVPFEETEDLGDNRWWERFAIASGELQYSLSEWNYFSSISYGRLQQRSNEP